jgi:hypothetical protein
VAVALVGALLAGCGGGGGGQAATSHAAASVPSRPAAAPVVVIPRLVGRQQDDAHRIAQRHGLKLRWTGFVGKLGNGRYEVSCVKVLSQSPVAGERRPRGSSVAIIEAACRPPSGRPHVL